MGARERHLGPLMGLAAGLVLAIGLFSVARWSPFDEGRLAARPESPSGEDAVFSPSSFAPPAIARRASPPAARDEAPERLDHGPLIERSRGYLAAELLDRLGRPTGLLDRTSVRIWRRVGPYRLEVPAEFVSGGGAVQSAGREGGGLESGIYEVAVDAGAFGRGETVLEISEDAPAVGRVLTTGYSRLVTLRFVDETGRPVPFLSGRPEFLHPRPARPRDRESEPPPVLRAPPATAGYLGYSHVDGPRRRVYRCGGHALWRTDEGRFRVRVVAGVGGRLRIPVGNGLFVADTRALTIESDFEGPEWDDYRIVLRPRPDYEASVATYSAPFIVDDPGRMEFCRLPTSRFRADAPEAAIVGAPRPRAGSRLTAGKGIRPVPVRIEIPPTLRAWARTATLGLELGDVEICTPGRQSISHARGVEFVAAIDPAELAVIDPRTRLVLGLSDRDSSGPGTTLWFDFPLDDACRRALAGGRLVLDLRERAPRAAGGLLVFRAVGPAGVGLPWVAGSVFELDAEPNAVDARETSRRLAREGRRPESFAARGESLSREWAGDLAALDVARPPWGLARPGTFGRARPSRSSEEVAASFEPELIEAYGLPALARLRRFDAWYDTVRTVDSDECGYVLRPMAWGASAGLAAGRRYVLYLWSRSRDDLVPDRRFVFEAKAGVTDLGAIALPGY